MKNGANEAGDQSQNGNLSQNETASLKLRQLSQIETQSQIETGGNVAGGERWVREARTGAALTHSQRVLHNKALRHIAGKYQELNLWGIEFIAALAAYLAISDRENVGVNVKDVIEWTGARSRWQKRMQEGAREAEAAGCIERIRSGVFGGREGFVMDLTEKGRRVLADYDKRMKELQEDFEARRAVNVLKMATRRLSLERRRANGEARRSLEAGGDDLA